MKSNANACNFYVYHFAVLAIAPLLSEEIMFEKENKTTSHLNRMSYLQKMFISSLKPRLYSKHNNNNNNNNNNNKINNNNNNKTNNNKNNKNKNNKNQNNKNSTTTTTDPTTTRTEGQ